MKNLFIVSALLVLGLGACKKKPAGDSAAGSGSAPAPMGSAVGSAAPAPDPAGSAAPGSAAPAGSADSAPAAGGSVTEKFIADYAAIKDKLCACADKACTEKLKAEADAHEKSGKSLPKPTKDEEQKFGAIEDEVNKCAKKY